MSSDTDLVEAPGSKHGPVAVDHEFADLNATS
jgi:hypothetical protein